MHRTWTWEDMRSTRHIRRKICGWGMNVELGGTGVPICPNIGPRWISMVFATSRSFKSDVLGLFSMSPRNAGPCLTHQRPPATSLKWTELAVNVQTQNIVTHLSMVYCIYLSGRQYCIYTFVHLYCTSMLTHTQTHMGRTTLQRRAHTHRHIPTYTYITHTRYIMYMIINK